MAGLLMDHEIERMIYDIRETQSGEDYCQKTQIYDMSLNSSNTIAEQYARNSKASAPPPFHP